MENIGRTVFAIPDRLHPLSPGRNGASAVVSRSPVGNQAPPDEREEHDHQDASSPFQQALEFHSYSARSASIGLMRAARRAGSQEATNATAMRSRVAPIDIKGLLKCMAGSVTASSRERATAPIKPRPDPISASLTPEVSTMRVMSPMLAPKAKRIANSPVR